MHNEVVSFLNEKVSGSNATFNEAEVGDSNITVEASKILEVCKALRDGEFEFNVLQVISGVDFLPAEGEEGRIEVNYSLASFTKNTELLLKIKVPRGDNNNLPKVNSVTSVWSAADWQERETYDLVGVNFVGHPNLVRILNPSEGWVGHPLRRDYEAQKEWEGMTVYPEEKMNLEDQAFKAKQEALNKAEKEAAKAAAAESKE
jgi:NADH-quinone oxidoreductase subunit C